MKYTTLTLLTPLGWASALTQQCTGTSKEEGGNWFCGSVNQIIYDLVPGLGTYKAVTDMTSSGQCNKEDRAYNGPIAPFDEDLSIHVRGPVNFKKFAGYSLTNSTIAHKTVTSSTVVSASQGAATGTYVPKYLSSRPKIQPVSYVPNWERIAFYDAEEQVMENITFMGNYGGQGSGVFDYTWGNSLSYLNAEGTGGSPIPQILKDVYIPSNKEFAIFSDKKCDADCGYSRVPEIAYKGFSGANKIFLFEFNMPHDGQGGFNGDMPAIWTLNGRIPRTAQYNQCSCWDTGCGEFDIYEVLASGDTKCKSTLHGNMGGGSSDYFVRPTSDYIKVAVLFHEKSTSLVIKQLDDDFDFSESLDDETVSSWLSKPKQGSKYGVSSLFQVAAA